MANSGFKGSIVRLSNVEILGTDEAAAVKLKVQFADSQGVVHAVTSHSLALVRDDDPDLYDAAAVFMRLLRERVTTLHFAEPEHGSPTTEKEQVIRGIGEALRDRLDSPDGVGTQG